MVLHRSAVEHGAHFLRDDFCAAFRDQDGEVIDAVHGGAGETVDFRRAAGQLVLGIQRCVAQDAVRGAQETHGAADLLQGLNLLYTQSLILVA